MKSLYYGVGFIPHEAGKHFRFPNLWGDLDDITVNPQGPQLAI